jgi:two-component sensor histidine kinase
MLKIVSVYFVLLLCGLRVAGQGLVDTPSTRLIQHIKQSKADTGRVKFLLALSKQLILKSGAGKLQVDSAYALEKQAEQLSVKANDLANLGKSTLMAAMIENKKGDRNKGLLLSQRALSYFTRINDLKDEAEATIIIGQHYELTEANIARIITYYQTAAELFRRSGDKERFATTLVDLADYQNWRNQRIESLKNLWEALKIYKSIGFNRLTNIYGLIGEDLLNLGNMPEALRYELLSERSAAALKDTTLQLSTVYYRIADCYRLLKDNNNAIIYSVKGLAIANKYHETSHIVAHTIALVQAYYQKHEYLRSINYLDKLKDLLDPADLEDVIYMNSFYVKNYLELKKFSLAKKYLDKLPPHINDAYLIDEAGEAHINYLLSTKQYQACYPFLKTIKHITEGRVISPDQVKNELDWFKADSGLGKYYDAMKHYQRSRTLSDSLFSLAKDNQVALLRIKYETDQKEQHLTLQAKSIELLKNNAQLEKQKQESRLYVLIAVLAITLTILVFGYSRYRLKQRTNLQLEAKQLEIYHANVSLQSLVTEKEWLLKEIHHRVKNNLQITMSLLSVQTHTTTSKIAKDALMNSQRRLHSMSLIHQKLYQSEKLAYIEMSVYITEMVTYLKDSFDHTNHIAFKTEAEKLELDVAQAVPLGLILNEAITNAIKHAFPDKRDGEITIKLSSDVEGFYHLIIADNGIGLSDNSTMVKESLGMELLKILTKQIDGELCIDGKNGTTITVGFKALALFQ